MFKYIGHLRQKLYAAYFYSKNYYGSYLIGLIVGFLSIGYYYWRIMSLLFMFDMFVITHHYFDGGLYLLLIFFPICILKQHFMDKWRIGTERQHYQEITK